MTKFDNVGSRGRIHRKSRETRERGMAMLGGGALKEGINAEWEDERKGGRTRISPIGTKRAPYCAATINDRQTCQYVTLFSTAMFLRFYILKNEDFYAGQADRPANQDKKQSARNAQSYRASVPHHADVTFGEIVRPIIWGRQHRTANIQNDHINKTQNQPCEQSFTETRAEACQPLTAIGTNHDGEHAAE